MKTSKIISIAGRVVFYLVMIFLTVLIIRSKELHPISQLVLIMVIASACFAVREWNQATEIDPKIPMSPEEEIMYREMMEEEEKEEVEKPTFFNL